MRKNLFLVAIFLCGVCFSQAQVTLTGKITSTSGEPLEGVSITIKDSYDGTTSAKEGSFKLILPDSNSIVLQFTLMGYKPVERTIDKSQMAIFYLIQLKEEITEIKAVVISAGIFEANDKKRSTVLKSVDVVTTAGQQADIVAALKTLPGAQQVGEQEGLFIRGGTGNETRVFIDGMMVTNPFFSSVPGIAQRGRFSPLLFKGTVFSSGGYSAQYGQGLSSALILESIDLPSRSEVNLILSSAQMSFMGQTLSKNKKGSAGLNVHYSNLQPYYNVIHQKYEFPKAPEAINSEINWRRKVKGGFLKFYSYINHNRVSFNRPFLNNNSFYEQFDIRNKNAFANTTFTGKLCNDWHLYTGASVSLNQDKIRMFTGNHDTTVSSFLPMLTNRTLQGKITFSKHFTGLSKLYLGAEYFNVMDKIVAKDSIAERKIDDNFIAAFIESDIYFSSKLVSRLGLRAEHSSLLKQTTLAPRISFAYKLKEGKQFSFAYGIFFQKPETNFLLRKNNLSFGKATHYILNYQSIFNGQTFRVEAFYKGYKKLLTTSLTNPFDISNNGNGYAKGVEVFWRDKTNISNLDYWVSYSFLDTKRKYLEYPSLVQPSFASTHTLSIVAKRWVNEISTYFSATYSFASGRPYFNPNRQEKDFMIDKTRSFHTLGLQANYLKTFGTVNAVFIINVSNALGSKQIFSYRYASEPNTQGHFNSEALTPLAKRFVFIGAYLSIGSDRRKDILD